MLRQAARDLLREPASKRHHCVGLGEVDERQLVLLRDEPRDLFPSHVAALDESLAEPVAREAVVAAVSTFLEDLLELLDRDERVPNEQDAECRPRLPCGFHYSRTSVTCVRLSDASRIPLAPARILSCEL